MFMTEEHLQKNRDCFFFPDAETLQWRSVDHDTEKDKQKGFMHSWISFIIESLFSVMENNRAEMQ